MPASRSDAFVTLLTSESYLPGVLVVATALRRYQTLASIVCIVTDTISEPIRQTLRQAFDEVRIVEEIRSDSLHRLSEIGRPELAPALTKLHVFNLVNYDSVVFLDADTLPQRNLDELFDLTIRHDFSACSDAGWPDAFNSGVFVTKPGKVQFERIRQVLKERGSWDGGDQGLLNEAFPNWNRMSFGYNCTPSNLYMYAPAYRRYGKAIALIHFIGSQKPWHVDPPQHEGTSKSSDILGDFLNQWYNMHTESEKYSTKSSVPSITSVPSIASIPLIEVVAPNDTISIIVEESTDAAEIDRAQTWSPPHVRWDPARQPPPLQGNQAASFNPGLFENRWDLPKVDADSHFEASETIQRPIPKSALAYISPTKPEPVAENVGRRSIFPWEDNPRRYTRKFPEDHPPEASLPTLALMSPPSPSLQGASGNGKVQDPGRRSIIPKESHSYGPRITHQTPDELEEDRESRYGDDEEEDSEGSTPTEEHTELVNALYPPPGAAPKRDAGLSTSLGLSVPSMGPMIRPVGRSGPTTPMGDLQSHKNTDAFLGHANNQGAIGATHLSLTKPKVKNVSAPRNLSLPNINSDGQMPRPSPRDLSPNAQMKAAMKERLLRPEGSGRVWDPARSLMKLKAENEYGQQRILGAANGYGS